MVIASLSVLAASLLVVYATTRSIDDPHAIEPLFAIDATGSDQPRLIATPTIEPTGPVAPVASTAPLADGVALAAYPVADASAAVLAENPAGHVDAAHRRLAERLAEAEAEAEADDPAASGHTTFVGRPIRAVRQLRMRVTAYCPCSKCCGKHADGKTASGYSVYTNRGRLVAADTRVLPFGMLVSVPGYDNDQPVPVLDRGRVIKGNRLDVLFPTHAQARAWGSRWLTVTVYEFVD